MFAGKLIVDGQEYSGRSQGNYQGLDLVADMYVGGFPNFSRLAQNSGFREGFVGMCVSGFWYLFSLQHLLLKFMKYVTVYTCCSLENLFSGLEVEVFNFAIIKCIFGIGSWQN